ncbi:MAG: bifunctional diaminohydroxyphosphoribosylaminopyrimidine deaminase/5-amino-6-(5-phosphoribosylamino)uracil reductase RibD [Phycisphaerales bacterium]|nr:bifunctional diaminohydroxyphosphoribosylaminopyrimidine deaminase/5-amino-6-(5-phosphoribosylamino)uracil reductase RibD [Phycisphaerales bacterium]
MTDERYIRRCLQLAENGKGAVAPNPMVAAVLLYENRIIGEGFHQEYAHAHAEVNCFESVAARDKQFIPQATMYVSLEPCAHYGKTPPCANRIVQEGVKRVVVCNKDPFEKVAGKGIQILRSNGIEVVSGVLEAEGAWLNRRFFTFHKQQRPYIILKWAQTESALFAPKDHARLQMSDEYSTRLSHQWRREESAILVGFTTAMNDNPQLIALYGQGNQPLRIALDKDLQLPATHHLLSQVYPTWIVNQHKEEVNGNIRFIKLDFGASIIGQLLESLFQSNILSLIVEGGATLLQHFLDANLWDEARVFETPNVMDEGIKAPSLSDFEQIFEKDLRQDKLLIYRNKNNPFTFPKDAAF